jgi:hypothetical protein
MAGTREQTTVTFTNVTADAVVTTEWLSTAGATLVVPVYQRQYRWEIDGCERLLKDLRAVARADAGQTHFVGSMLYTATSTGEDTEWMLVDGQQRVTTLMLLIAAIRDTLAGHDEATAGVLDRILHHPTHAGQTRLRLRREGERELAGIVYGRQLPDVGVAVTHLQDNYDYFLHEIRDDALEVWSGLQRLVHVAITLREHVNPQQVFESLNSTGTPLRNHELIHNYVLMGLTEQQQSEIEDSFWIPIEENTGDAIDSFLRDYLILKTGRDSDFTGDRGVYEVFKKEFPAPRYPSLPAQAAEWKAHAEVYRVLLDPSRCADGEVARQLKYCNTFGSAMYPLLLGVYRDYQLNVIDRNHLLEILEQLQSLYLRKMVVGASRDHLAAQLCRKRRQYGYPIREIARRMPTDERIREALKHNPLPHAGYVLRRIEEPHDLDHLGDLQIEHIFPQFPSTTWSGDGAAEWGTFSEVQRAAYREVLPTIGNLALLEPSLNAAASNKPFPAKTTYYAASKVPLTRQLAGTLVWDLERIADRTRALSEQFLEIWQRPSIASATNPEHLVPILDAQRKPGYYTGWKTEFEYVSFQGEHWEARNAKDLYQRTFERLWETRQREVLDYSASHGGPVFKTQEWNGRWEPMGDHYLFMGFFPQYMLAAVQGVLDEFDMVDEVFVNYSTNDD